jgi:translocation and assembly module TamA
VDLPSPLLRAPNALSWLPRTFALIGLLWALHCAAAETPAFYIEVVAPPDLKKLLEAELDAARWSTRSELTARQIDQLFEAAPDQARALAETEGYFEARVAARRLERDGKPLLRLELVPGEPTRVAAVDVRVEGPVTTDAEGAQRIAKAQRAFRLKPGDVFRQANWADAKERVVRSLARKRYALARIVDSRAQIDPAAHTARLSMSVDSGPSVTLGPVQVKGLQRYSPRLVQNLNPIRPGSVYDEEEMLKYQRRLIQSGHFSSALVSANPSAGQPTGTPLLVTVVEAQARRIELGVGYSTDRGPRAQANYTDNNALDRGWRSSLQVEVDRLVQEATVGLAFPRQESGWHYGLGGNVKHEDIQDQEVLNWSLTGVHLYAVEEYESALSLQFLTERSRLGEGEWDNADALFLNQRWLWNWLDDPINPRRGSTFQVQVGGASEALLSAQTFGRMHLRANHLQRLLPRLTLQLRGEAGAVLADSRQGIPSEYVFRTGGDTSIRGYAFESLGVDENGAVVGGRYLVVGSVELISWFTSEWGSAAFVDAGNAWDELDAFNPVYGVGFGARWRSPVGNLNLDLAWPEGRGEGRVHFSVGIIFR